MKAKDIARIIEEFAPLKYQASYDNSGFTVGNPEREVEGVMLAVDVTEEVVAEAIEAGVNMIITHHPIIFTPIKRLMSQSYVERCVEAAIKNDIILYAAHTNLDSTPEGMSWRVGEILGLKNMQVLSSSSQDEGVGYGVVGELESSVDMEEYIKYVGKRLNCRALRYSDLSSSECRRVAVCTGSGGSLMGSVSGLGVDLYVTSDLKYNDFMTPSGEYTVVDVGHYESEYCVIEILFDILSKKMINFAVRKSSAMRNPINYISLL